MLDENEHSRKEDGRSLHRLLHKAEQQDATVEVDSAAFFSELPPEQSAPPRRPQQNTRRNTAGGENGAYLPPKRGKILLIVQAILSVLALVQLWRTQMLPVLYLVVLAALLVLLWLLVKRCQEYKTAARPCCAGRYDQRFFEQRRGEKDHQRAFCGVPERRGYPW